MKRYFSLAALVVFLTACARAAPSMPVPLSTGTAASTQTAAVSEGPQVSDYAFPVSIDPESRYMFYLHGQIIEDQGLAAVSPVFGAYEYVAILEALRSHGFVVISEQRSGGTDVDAYAQKVLSQCLRGTSQWWAPPRGATLRPPCLTCSMTPW